MFVQRGWKGSMMDGGRRYFGCRLVLADGAILEFDVSATDARHASEMAFRYVLDEYDVTTADAIMRVDVREGSLLLGWEK
jgi:hypothetical protein